MRKRHFLYTWMAALLLLTATGCKDTLSNLFDGDAPDMQGEAIAFTSQLPAVQGTSQTRATADTGLLKGYKAVNQNYDFTITMLKKEGDATGSTGKYKATTDTQNGVLSSVSNPLYWQDNVNQYGFKAEAGSDVVAKVQTTSELWLKQDKLVGFGYEPLLGDDNSTAVDKLDAYNYRTNKEWYKANKDWMNDKQSLVSDDKYKRIPLFLQHKRSLITVIVKAGEGVDRKDVLAATASTKLDTHIYSYTAPTDGDVTTTEVSPLQGSETVTYEKDVNGEAETSVVARYDAIVEPYDYVPASDDEEGPKICSINLSGQHFSFYASNDSRYGEYKGLETEDAKQSSDFYKAYHLQAGDNLVITVTLSRDSRKILMTAYVQPWSDVVTTYVCDDFGTSGSTTVISEKQQLIDFLNSEKLNATGNVAILNTDSIKLDDTWEQSYNLNAILNMGNHTLTVNNRLFNKIASSGSLINGTLKVNKSSSDVKTLVCQTNEGTIDRLTLMNNNETDRAVVTRAAVAETNYGYITNVSSRIKVEGKADAADGTTYIGGIAGVSKSEDGTFIPSVTGCTVDARVGIASGQTNVKGGGIVGAANGYVSGNTFEYGVTLSQTNVKNIVYANVSDNHDLSLMASDNEWPTVAENQVEGMDNKKLDNAREDLYNAVLDCQEELKELVKANSTYNNKDNSYRLSDSFSVLSQDWELGKKNDSQTGEYWGNVLFDLEGNNKTITLGGTKTIAYSDTKDATESKSYTTAPMLFCNIMGTVKNLTLQCAESLYGIPQYGTSGENSSSDICAPLAYSVIGGTVENVDVRAVKKSSGNYPAVVAAIPAGLVVWANQNATITNCSSDMDVYMKVSGNYSTTADARLYAGGLIAQVAKATVTQCQYEPRTEYAFKCLKGNSDTYEGNANLVFGGIIGGTVIKTGSPPETPWVTITDCSSFYSFNADDVKFTEGSVLGRSIYVSENNLSGVNKTACQGNWWPTGTKGVGDNNADEKVIGKRNSVTPDRK